MLKTYQINISYYENVAAIGESTVWRLVHGDYDKEQLLLQERRRPRGNVEFQLEAT